MLFSRLILTITPLSTALPCRQNSPCDHVGSGHVTWLWELKSVDRIYYIEYNIYYIIVFFIIILDTKM